MNYSEPTNHSPLSKAAWLAGWLLSAPPIVMLGVGGIFACVRNDQMSAGMARIGYPSHVMPVLITLEITSAILYAIPQTAVLGAILLTGYFGGAIASHVRVDENKWIVAAMLGVMTWLGLYLRDPRVRALLPWRRIRPVSASAAAG